MRINTNAASLNSQRILGQTGAAVNRGIGRLSSGFRLNRAADDAAGLGIANKLRADTRALRQAARNAEQATSLLQVAEGAVQTVQNIVDRMKELGMQSASDNVNDTDRGLIQDEFTQLQAEITRIVDTTKFQGSVLLNGSLGNYADAAAAGSDFDAAVGFSAFRVTGAQADTFTFTQVAGAVTVSNSDGSLTQTVTATAGGAQSLVFDKLGITVDTHANFAIGAGAENLEGDMVVAGANTSFLVSSSGAYGAGGADSVTVSSLDLSLATLDLDGESLASKSGAQDALVNIDAAITTISAVFGDIGATQNRIDYATANVKTSIENFAAAESTIRDADMAAEMAEFTKNQILQQAGVAMLAQANSAPQLVLRLLQ
jgi:flagellin